MHNDMIEPYLEEQRRKCSFFNAVTEEIWFEYLYETDTLFLSRKTADRLGLEQTISDTQNNKQLMSYFLEGKYEQLLNIFKSIPEERSYYEDEMPLNCKDGERWFRMSARFAFDEDESKAVSVFGVFQDIDEGVRALEKIESSGAAEPEKDGAEQELTAGQVNALMEYLKQSFAVVRLVDPQICMQYAIDCMGKIIERPYHCYTQWNKQERCANCISAAVAHSRRPISKLEFVNNEIYNVSASYISVDGKPYVLELANYVDCDTMFSGSERQDVLGRIAAHNRQLYIDPVTGIYNRRYFDDKLRDLNGEFAFAMLDVDNFKQINDTYGHIAGDAALAAAAKAIKSSVRSCDDVIRYGGDEFFLFFRNMPREVIAKKLEKILRAVQNIRLEEYPELRMTVSIGGAYERGKLSRIMCKADMAMYEAKNTKNSYSIYKD